MSPATTATSRTQKREAVSPARSPPPLAFQSGRLYPATTSTNLSLLDSSVEGPPGPGHVTTTTSTTLPLERGGSWPPGHHIHHPPTSSRYERGGPGLVTSPPVPPSRSRAEGPPGPGHHIHHPPTCRFERGESTRTQPRHHHLLHHPPARARRVLATRSPHPPPSHLFSIRARWTRPPHPPPSHLSIQARRVHPDLAKSPPPPPPSRSSAEGPGHPTRARWPRPHHLPTCPLDQGRRVHPDLATSPPPPPPSRSSAEGPGHPVRARWPWPHHLPTTVVHPASSPLHLYHPPAQERRVHLDPATTSTTLPPVDSSTQGPP